MLEKKLRSRGWLWPRKNVAPSLSNLNRLNVDMWCRVRPAAPSVNVMWYNTGGDCVLNYCAAVTVEAAVTAKGRALAE